MEYGKTLIDKAAKVCGSDQDGRYFGGRRFACRLPNSALLIIKKLALQWVKSRFKKIIISRRIFAEC